MYNRDGIAQNDSLLPRVTVHHVQKTGDRRPIYEYTLQDLNTAVKNEFEVHGLQKALRNNDFRARLPNMLGHL